MKDHDHGSLAKLPLFPTSGANYNAGLLARRRSARYQALHQDAPATRPGTEPDLEAQTGVGLGISNGSGTGGSNSGSRHSTPNDSTVHLTEVAPEPVK